LLLIVEQLNGCATHDCHGISTRTMTKVLGYDLLKGPVLCITFKSNVLYSLPDFKL
jgi:hypothetical protein